MRRFTLLASGAAIAALVLAGCGDNQTPSPGGGAGPGPDPQASTLKLLAEHVAKKSAEKSSAHVVIKTGAAGMSFEGTGDVKLGAEPAMQLTMNLPGQGAMEMRLVKDVFYVKLPEEVEPGKPWVKIDANGDDALSRTFGALVREIKRSGDPSQTLRQFEEVGEITSTKQEQLDGKDTTHYTVTVDVQKMIDKQTDEDLKKLVEQAAKSGVQNFPLNIWVDSESLPVRIAMDIPVSDQAQQKTQQVQLSIDYSDWGKPVTVDAPAPDEVAEFSR